MGSASSCRSRFLPRLFAKNPAGMAPQNAPSVKNAPIHEPSSLVMWKFVYPRVSLCWYKGKAGLDHDMQVPALKAPKVTETKK